MHFVCGIGTSTALIFSLPRSLSVTLPHSICLLAARFCIEGFTVAIRFQCKILHVCLCKHGVPVSVRLDSAFSLLVFFLFHCIFSSLSLTFFVYCLFFCSFFPFSSGGIRNDYVTRINYTSAFLLVR